MPIVNKYSKEGRSATIIPRTIAAYNAATFEQYKKPFFKEVSAEEALDCIKPIKFDFLDSPVIAFDTETFCTGVNANRMPYNVQRRWIKRSSSKYIPQDFPFCFSLCDGTNSYVVYDTLENHFQEFKKLEVLLADRSIAKTGHNIDYDMHMSANVQVEICGRLYDTMHLSKLCRADAFSHSLLDIAVEIQNLNELNEHYAPTIPEFEHMLDAYKAAYKVTDYRQFPHELMTQYTSADTWNTIWVLKELYPRVVANEQLPLFETESEMLITAFKMERTGIHVELDYEDILIPELEKEVDDAERKIYDTAGTRFNINSANQLEDVLKSIGYGNLIQYKKPTDTMLAKGITKGNASFDKYQMERLENEGVPLIKDIQQYRASEKLLNTFARKLYEMRDAEAYVHCNINTIEAKTGRFSISAPSMQNMPRRKDSRIRDAFTPPEGYTFYDFDFKSQESVILVHYSRSQYLMSILNTGGDIHKAVASIIYSIPYDQVSKELRNISKSVEFAIVYGAGPAKVASMTGLSLDESSVAMKTFLKNAPEVDIFIKTANKIAKERRKIRTIRNRIVYVEHGREYACVNYIIQGSAADSTKTRMVLIHKFIMANKLNVRMVLQVHDSLLYIVGNDVPTEVLGWLRWLQEERELFRVPVAVDVGKCDNTWRSKHDIDVESIKPPQEMLDKAMSYDIWNEGILTVKLMGGNDNA